MKSMANLQSLDSEVRDDATRFQLKSHTKLHLFQNIMYIHMYIYIYIYIYIYLHVYHSNLDFKKYV